MTPGQMNRIMAKHVSMDVWVLPGNILVTRTLYKWLTEREKKVMMDSITGIHADLFEAPGDFYEHAESNPAYTALITYTKIKVLDAAPAPGQNEGTVH